VDGVGDEQEDEQLAEDRDEDPDRLPPAPQPAPEDEDEHDAQRDDGIGLREERADVREGVERRRPMGGEPAADLQILGHQCAVCEQMGDREADRDQRQVDQHSAGHEPHRRSPGERRGLGPAREGTV